jgi:hypothetical protein
MFRCGELNLSYNSAKWCSKHRLLRSTCMDICVTFRQDPCTVKDTGNGLWNDSSSTRTFPQLYRQIDYEPRLRQRINPRDKGKNADDITSNRSCGSPTCSDRRGQDGGNITEESTQMSMQDAKKNIIHCNSISWLIINGYFPRLED